MSQCGDAESSWEVLKQKTKGPDLVVAKQESKQTNQHAATRNRTHKHTSKTTRAPNEPRNQPVLIRIAITRRSVILGVMVLEVTNGF